MLKHTDALARGEQHAVLLHKFTALLGPREEKGEKKKDYYIKPKSTQREKHS